MLKNRIKKSIGVLTMACFLATPISYVISANTTEAAPPPPPRHRMAPPPPPQDDKVPDWKKAPPSHQDRWKPAPKRQAPPPPPPRHGRHR